jgi:hypothetical protein
MIRHTICACFLLSGALLAHSAVSVSVQGTFAPSAVQPPASAANLPIAAHFHPDRFAGRAGKYYSLVWGVDSLSVKQTESGEIIRFAYRVVDTEKSKIINDKAFEPSLIDPQAGVKLVVPTLEQVGILRQSAPPETGKMYWMAFSNSGRKVKRGDRVYIEIGQFRAGALVVD